MGIPFEDHNSAVQYVSSMVIRAKRLSNIQVMVERQKGRQCYHTGRKTMCLGLHSVQARSCLFLDVDGNESKRREWVAKKWCVVVDVLLVGVVMTFLFAKLKKWNPRFKIVEIFSSVCSGWVEKHRFMSGWDLKSPVTWAKSGSRHPGFMACAPAQLQLDRSWLSSRWEAENFFIYEKKFCQLFPCVLVLRVQVQFWWIYTRNAFLTGWQIEWMFFICKVHLVIKWSPFSLTRLLSHYGALLYVLTDTDQLMYEIR